LDLKTACELELCDRFERAQELGECMSYAY
jgi:hypothetical protein